MKNQFGKIIAGIALGSLLVASPRAEDTSAAVDFGKFKPAPGVEFVEVDPIALGRETFEELSDEDQKELGAEIKVDPAFL